MDIICMAYFFGIQNNNTKAIEFFTKAIELNKYFAEAYCARGSIYGFDLQDYSKSILDYNIAIEINPEYAFAYNDRGCVSIMRPAIFIKSCEDWRIASSLGDDIAKKNVDKILRHEG